MGEISELMLNGTLCCQCGACLREDVIDKKLGFPIICDSCYQELSDKEKKDYVSRHENCFKKTNQ